jgi:hypothetical protein
MKRVIITAVIIAQLGISSYSQVSKMNEQNNKAYARPDTSVVEFKKREILIIRNPVKRTRTMEHSLDTLKTYFQKKKEFKGMWPDIEAGFNNYLDNTGKIASNAGSKKLELKTYSSFEFTWNITKTSFKLYKDKLGIFTGIGLTFNNYYFKNQIKFLKDTTPNQFVYDTTSSFKRNKLAITYLNIPLILDYQVKVGQSRFHISAGVTGSIKTGSRIKQAGGDHDKHVYKGSYQLSPYKLQGTLRIGYGSFDIYTNYSFTKLFKTNKGPELYPISFGIGIDF